MKHLLDVLTAAIEERKCPTCGKPLATIAGPVGPMRHRGHGYYAANAYDQKGADERRCMCGVQS